MMEQQIVAKFPIVIRNFRPLLMWAGVVVAITGISLARKPGNISVQERGAMTTKETVERYFDTLKQKKDWQFFLADDMVFTSFTSPVKQVVGKKAYLQATKGFYGGIVTFELRDLIIEGDKACALTRYQLQRPGAPAFESDVAEVFRVRDGKIMSFDIYFDSAPFPK